MTVPWVPFACLAGVLVVGLLYKRFGPREAQTPSHPLWWVMVIVVVMVFGTIAVASLQH